MNQPCVKIRFKIKVQNEAYSYTMHFRMKTVSMYITYISVSDRPLAVTGPHGQLASYKLFDPCSMA